MTTPRDPDRLAWAPSIPFFAVHAAALATPFLFPATTGLVALAAALYVVRMFAITAGYHRYFAHRAYKTGRVFQFVLAFLGGMSAQKGALWWAAHHRDHHRFSDTEQDVHSPIQRGFWWSHVGWFLSTRYDRTELENASRTSPAYPELRWLDRWHCGAAGRPRRGCSSWPAAGPALVWGFFVSTVLLWHGTFCINSLCPRLRAASATRPATSRATASPWRWSPSARAGTTTTTSTPPPPTRAGSGGSSTSPTTSCARWRPSAWCATSACRRRTSATPTSRRRAAGQRGRGGRGDRRRGRGRRGQAASRGRAAPRGDAPSGSRPPG